jgi:hypothetical protein
MALETPLLKAYGTHRQKKFFDEKEYWAGIVVDDASASLVVLDVCTDDNIGFSALSSVWCGCVNAST